MLAAIRALISFQICVDVQRSGSMGSADYASKEECLDDLANVVVFATRLAYFHTLRIAKDTQTNEWCQEFYEKTHEDLCDILERNEVTVFCIAFIVHILMANLNVYSISPEPVVSVSQKMKNGGRLGYMEIVLSLVMAGQCNEAARYGKNEDHLNFFFDHRNAERSIRVPGIGLSQLDPRNVNALAFCHPILKDLGEDDMPKHNPAVTANGKHGRKAEFFFDKPVYLGGYPSRAHAEAAVEEDDDEEENAENPGE